MAMQIAATQAINAQNNSLLPPTSTSTSTSTSTGCQNDGNHHHGNGDNDDCLNAEKNGVNGDSNNDSNSSNEDNTKNVPESANNSNVVCITETMGDSSSSSIPLGTGTPTIPPGVGTLDPHSVPIAATIITPQGIFVATHNPRMQNRINLMAPHTTTHNTTRAESECNTIPDTVSTNVPVRAVTAEGVRVLSCVGVLESGRSKVQAHSVRLMNERGKHRSADFVV